MSKQCKQSRTDGPPLTKNIYENQSDQSSNDKIRQTELMCDDSNGDQCDESEKSSVMQGKHTCENSNRIEQPYQCNERDQSVSAEDQLPKAVQVAKTDETDNQTDLQ